MSCTSPVPRTRCRRPCSGYWRLSRGSSATGPSTPDTGPRVSSRWSPGPDMPGRKLPHGRRGSGHRVPLLIQKGTRQTMKTALKKTQRAGMMAAVGVAMVSAGLLLAALAGAVREAEATFSGANGFIALASDRTTGEGVNNPEGDFEIFTMNRDGTGLEQLTENAALDFDPEWSPDGKRIAFHSDRHLFSNIFVMDADGTEQTQVTKGRSFDRNPTFSPDGNRVAFDSNLEAGKGVDNPE